MQKISLILLLIIVISSCSKEEIKPGTGVKEVFMLKVEGSSMQVTVEGNTQSKVFLIFVHGGPGGDANIYNSECVSKNIENKYAAVYWEQRNAGATQGTANSGNLTLEQMTEDLKYLIFALKERYSSDIKIFLLAHSFGGLLTTSFMTTDDYQNLVDGWIYADGSHNFPMNDSLTQSMLQKIGNEQIALSKNIEFWNEVVDFCSTHSVPFAYDDFITLNSYAHTAETKIDDVNVPDFGNYYSDLIKDKYPISSKLVNSLGSIFFGKTLKSVTYSDKLPLINVPVLIIYGKYDFVCPKELGEEIYNKINSSDKQIIISDVSGHSVMFNDEIFFYTNVEHFIAERIK